MVKIIYIFADMLPHSLIMLATTLTDHAESVSRECVCGEEGMRCVGVGVHVGVGV